MMANAVDGDPLLRAQAVRDAVDRSVAARLLLADKSFCAALDVGERHVLDLVADQLRKAANVSKRALEEQVKAFQRALIQAEKASDAKNLTDPRIAREADELLRDPGLVGRFYSLLVASGVVGEQRAALTVLLAAVSRNQRAPLHLVVKAASSAGKNYVVNKVLDLLPPDDLLSVTDMSPRVRAGREVVRRNPA